MKLLYCPECSDIVLLRNQMRSCECGRARGRYLEDGWHAVVSDSAIMLGIANRSLIEAIVAHKKDASKPLDFRAFIIEDPCPRVERMETT